LLPPCCAPAVPVPSSVKETIQAPTTNSFMLDSR
jgi:hypothetical protein